MNDRYHVIPRTLIFIFHEDHVLLLRGAETKKNFPGYLNGLGGHVESGETIHAGAIRELAEESGIRDVPLRLCGISIDASDPTVGITVHVFRGTVNERPKLFASSEGELGWYRRDDLSNEKTLPDLLPFLDLIRDRQPEDGLFYATANWQRGELIIEEPE